MEKCRFCEKEGNYDLETASGDPICEACADERCMQCLEGSIEHETADGEYICTHCHSSNVDDTYEYMVDRNYR